MYNEKILIFHSLYGEEGKKSMKLATFKGGVHPYDGKEITSSLPVQAVQPKEELVFPMAQHIGAMAVPVVKVKDTVLMGQMIAQAQGGISANVISSVSGTVKAIEPRLTADGKKVLSIVIENDKKDTPIEGFGKHRDYRKLGKEEIREIIKEAGIVGMGGAGFPTHIKLTPKEETKIDTVIINGAECEPYLTSDYRMMLEEAERIIEGLKIELQLFNHAKGIIAIEDNKLEAIQKLEELVKKEKNIEVYPLKTKYPQGGERFLIYAVTGRMVNSSMLPADVGCIVSNIDTAISIQRAVAESTPLIRRIITVSGDAVQKPGNFHVRIGTSYTELLEAAGGFSKPVQKLISGGPMMGKAIFSTDIPVTKTSSALLAFTEDEAAEFEPSACIRCGRCADVCPGNIIPQKIMEYALRSDAENFVKYDGMECCECGCCTYVCPAKRRLTQAFKQMKAEVSSKRKKA